MRLYRISILALIAAVAASASAQVVDRGLPDANLNNGAGANRSNVAWAYDYGNTGIEGDTFTMPTLPDGSWVIDTIRTWVVGPAGGPGTGFSDVKLYLGAPQQNLGLYAGANFTSPLTTDNPNVTVTPVLYNNLLEPTYQGSGGGYIPMFQMDFNNLNLGAASGQSIAFAPIGTAINNSFAWFNHASNAALGGVPADSADGLLEEFTFTGNYIDTYSSLGNGWDKASDINVQVYAHSVPEPASLLVVAGAAGIALMRRRKKA